MVRFLVACAFALSLSAADFEQPRSGSRRPGGRPAGRHLRRVSGAGRRKSIGAHVLAVGRGSRSEPVPDWRRSFQLSGDASAFGARVGRRLGPFGIYGKLRPGFIRFDRNLYDPKLGTQPALDAGGILELYSSRHVAGRFDLGDTIGLVRRGGRPAPVAMECRAVVVVLGYFPLMAASMLMLFSSRMVPMARCSAARAFT